MERDAARPAAAKELTGAQREAVRRRSEPLLVSAAAGSGKTSVLVERFVGAVRQDGVSPSRILAITFTERAAGELRERVRRRLLELGDRDAARDTEAALAGTFHGFCARLLRTHPLAAGLDPDFTILDEGLAGRLRELAFESAVRGFVEGERGEAVDLLAAYGVDRVRSMIVQVHAELRSRGQRRPRLPAAAPGEHADGVATDAARACALLDELLERFGTAYEELKRGRAKVDFDDLELVAAELLREREDIRAAWSERFELLMVDEFQDTNPRQLAILMALDRGNLFTVGDELQSIYGFRHADVSLFRSRRARLEQQGACIALTRNFRSREPLLDAVNAVFSDRFAGYAPLLAAEGGAEESADPRVELLLTSTAGWELDEELGAAIAAGLPHSQRWRQAEARMLAQRVWELVDRGETRAGDVAVLVRASGDLEVFERALQLLGLRTLAAVGTFWGHQQIGDLVSYLRALANPLDEEALYGVLASPLGGCSRDGLALLADAARESGRGAWAAALDAGVEGELAARLTERDRAALGSLCERLAAERAGAPQRTISELIVRAVEQGGYREHVLALEWGERRLANVHKLLRLARRFEAEQGRDLRGFLDQVEYLREAIRVEPDAPVEGVEPDAVRLMTVHAAKGLEFPVVCLADLGRQPRTQTPDLLVQGQRIGIRLARLDGEKSRPALDYEELCRERQEREAQEEDRILYVAMTRARERLLLSGAIDFERWPRSQQAPTPISWLAPALHEELPMLVQQTHEPVLDLAVAPGAPPTVRCRLNTPANVGEVLRVDVVQPAVAPAAATAATVTATAAEAEASAAARGVGDGVTRPGSSVASAPVGVEGPGTREDLRGEGEPLPSLSYTALSELERCGYRYYLERVLGLAEDRAAARGTAPGEWMDARARGTLAHRLMELLDFVRPRPPGPEDVAATARELGIAAGVADCAEIAALIAAASRAATAVRVAQAGAIRREHPFAFALAPSEPLITGVIDLLAVEADGGHLVLDYKSDRVAPGEQLDVLVEHEYAIQRLLYALAVLREGAVAVEIVHWFLERPAEPVAVRYTAGERLELEQQLADRLAAAREDPFEVTHRPHRALCLTCPGRVGLCSWGEAQTLRERPDELAAAPTSG
jgi:ATP-dependent exoDNAse (exonuclease V) beta subunit